MHLESLYSKTRDRLDDLHGYFRGIRGGKRSPPSKKRSFRRTLSRTAPGRPPLVRKPCLDVDERLEPHTPRKRRLSLVVVGRAYDTFGIEENIVFEWGCNALETARRCAELKKLR
jgi:hypothetical protein